MPKQSQTIAQQHLMLQHGCLGSGEESFWIVSSFDSAHEMLTSCVWTWTVPMPAQRPALVSASKRSTRTRRSMDKRRERSSSSRSRIR